MEHPEILLSETGLPCIPSRVYRTPYGTPYLKDSGVAMISRPHVDLTGTRDFLEGFGADLGFAGYLDDPVALPPAEALVKFAGQACYLALDEKRSHNAQAGKYLEHIKASGHGSVTEHANFSFLFWGIDRSVTHELVRHRAGFGFSQVSQRYVDGKKLRFVERPEYQPDRLPAEAPEGIPPLAWADLKRVAAQMHQDFEADIDRARMRYDAAALHLGLARDLGHPMLQGGSRTEARKQVNQAARECLPNSAEAPIVVTANVRAWRHATEMRAAGPADVQIRSLIVKASRCLRLVAPMLFGDYRETTLPGSGTVAVENDHRKI